MKRNKRLMDKIWLGFCISWVVIVEVLCMMLLQEDYRKFIANTGAFFIPLISSLGIIFWLLYIFVFKFPTIQELKAKLADVFKRGNIQKEDFDKIAIAINDAMETQTKVEIEEEVKVLEEKKEIAKKELELKQIETQTILDIAQNIKDMKVEENVQKVIKNDIKSKVQSAMEAY